MNEFYYQPSKKYYTLQQKLVEPLMPKKGYKPAKEAKRPHTPLTAKQQVACP